MTIEHVTDHGDEGVAFLISQFRDKPSIEILVRALMTQVQAAEDALFALLTERAIDTAVGAQLVVLGKIVGQEQGTFDEETFRTLIRGRVLVNRSSGTVDQMIELVNTLLPAGASLVVREYYPAAFQIEVTGSIPDFIGNAIAGMVLEAKGLGIGPNVTWFNGAAAWKFAAVASTPELGSPNGFGVGRFAAGSTGVGDVNVVPALAFNEATNSQYLGAI